MEDINVTKRLVEAGKLLGIEVFDHLVVNGDSKFTSLKERAFLKGRNLLFLQVITELPKSYVLKLIMVKWKQIICESLHIKGRI